MTVCRLRQGRCVSRSKGAFFGRAGSWPLVPKGSLEPGHASLPGLAGRKLAAGRRPVPAHKSVSVVLLDTTAPRGSALPCGLSQDRERRAVVLWGSERSQVRNEQLDMLERRTLVFLEIETEPAGGEVAAAVRLFPCNECVSSSASAIVTRPISRAATSAMKRLSRCARRKEPSDPKNATPLSHGVSAPAVSVKSLGSGNKIRLSLATIQPATCIGGRAGARPPNVWAESDLRGGAVELGVHDDSLKPGHGRLALAAGQASSGGERDGRSPGFKPLLAGDEASSRGHHAAALRLLASSFQRRCRYPKISTALPLEGADVVSRLGDPAAGRFFSLSSTWPQ